MSFQILCSSAHLFGTVPKNVRTEENLGCTDGNRKKKNCFGKAQWPTVVFERQRFLRVHVEISSVYVYTVYIYIWYILHIYIYSYLFIYVLESNVTLEKGNFL